MNNLVPGISSEFMSVNFYTVPLFQQRDDLQATYVVSRSDDLWNSHRNQPVPLNYDEPDCLDPRQRIDMDPSDVDPREVDHFSDDSSRIQCLNGKSVIYHTAEQFLPGIDLGHNILIFTHI